MTGEKFIEILDCLKGIITGTKWEGHVYAVGGSVRDYAYGRNYGNLIPRVIFHRDIKDIDLVIDLPNGGIEFANWLYDNGYTHGHVVTYEHYGTAMFRLKEYPEEELEAVQTRKECYRDMESRNPETAFGAIEDDCQRRDFTYNALYMDVTTKEIHDFNGHSIADLQDNILRTCGDPDIIFTEDPLRILRAIRFACRYESLVHARTLGAICKYAPRLEIISRERIHDELNKILLSGHVKRGVNLLFNTGIMEQIIPGFKDNMKIEFETKKLFDSASQQSLTVYLAMLLHSFPVAKAEEFMRNLKYEVSDIKEVKFLLEKEDLFRCEPTVAMVRMIQDKCKTPEMYGKLLDFHNILSQGAFDTYGKFRYCNETLIEDNRSMYDYKLPVDGNFIMEYCQIEPCEMVKVLLNLLREEAWKNPGIDKTFCKNFLEEHANLWLF